MAGMMTLPWRLPSTRTLVFGGVAVVVAVLLAGGAYLWSAARQEQMEQAWAAVSAEAHAATAPDATATARTEAGAAVEAFLAQYPSAPDAGEAAYVLGNLRFAAAQYPGARAAYEIAGQKATAPTIRILARFGSARAWEAEGDFARAAESLEALLRDLKPTQFAYEEALFDLARAQELFGKKEAAAETYRRLLKDVPAARNAEEAKIRLASLASIR